MWPRRGQLPDRLGNHFHFAAQRPAGSVEGTQNQRFARRHRCGHIEHRLPDHRVLRAQAGLLVRHARLLELGVQPQPFRRAVQPGLNVLAHVDVLGLAPSAMNCRPPCYP